MNSGRLFRGVGWSACKMVSCSGYAEVAALDDAYHIWHASVAVLDIKFVANLEERAVRGKVFVKKMEKLFANINAQQIQC